MNRRTKILIGLFVLFFIFFWIGGENSPRNNLAALIYYDNQELTANQETLNRQLEELIRSRPLRNQEIPELELKATAAFSLFLNNYSEEKILFQKENQQRLPIASLTKLMTTWVVLEHYDLSEEVTVSHQAANQLGDARSLTEGNVYTVKYLLYPLLIESSNSAAFALSEKRDDFMDLMNSEAEKIGMEDTFFVNPTGLDPEKPETGINQSTAEDLARLIERLLEKPLVWEILSLPVYSLSGPELINTNRFLLKETDRIVGGKTGYTDLAGGCLALVTEAPKDKGLIINIILGTNGRENRFEEMEKLINWLEIAYQW